MSATISHPRFAGPQSFFRLPTESTSSSLKIIGAPYDTGATFRNGARFAPRAVREASLMLGTYHPDFDVNFLSRGVTDGGDLVLTLNNSAENLRIIETAIVDIHRAKAKSAVIGGDHSLLLAELRALKKVYGNFALLHFDSHADVGDAVYGEDFHHGTPIKHAVEEELLDGKKIFQIGIRGPTWTPGQQQYVRSHGIQVLERTKLAQFDEFMQKARKEIGSIPVHVTFDVDLIDPAFAPAAGTPMSGGISPYEAITMLRSLKGLNIVSADVCEVTPSYDVADLTSQVAAALLYEEVALMCT
jgi:agmatinase